MNNGVYIARYTFSWLGNKHGLSAILIGASYVDKGVPVVDEKSSGRRDRR